MEALVGPSICQRCKQPQWSVSRLNQLSLPERYLATATKQWALILINSFIIIIIILFVHKHGTTNQK